jgi:hypothetical protein
MISYVSRSWPEATIMRKDGWEYICTKSVPVYNDKGVYGRDHIIVVLLKKEFPAVEHNSMQKVA